MREKSFIVEPLDIRKHHVQAFDCGVLELTHFLQKRARKEMDAHTSACFVLVSQEKPGCIAGYYTLSAAEIVATEIPVEHLRKMPRHDRLPATLLSRLARDISFRGHGIGDRLIYDALARAFASSPDLGAVAMIATPSDPVAENFYLQFHFRRLSAGHMFLSMSEIARLLQKRDLG